MTGGQHGLVEGHWGWLHPEPRRVGTADSLSGSSPACCLLAPGKRNGGDCADSTARRGGGSYESHTLKLPPSCSWGHGPGCSSKTNVCFHTGSWQAPGKEAQDHGQHLGSGPGRS